MLPSRESTAVWASIRRRGRGIVGFFATIGLVLFVTTVLIPSAVSTALQPQEYWMPFGGDIDGEALADSSGHAVVISENGSRVAVGAYANDGGGDAAGHVRVFDLVGGVWVQVGGDIDGEDARDQSGWSVAMSADGSRVAVGAVANDDAGIWAGHVRVFDLVGGVWVQVGGDIDGEAPGDVSGWAVSLSADGSRVVVGANTNRGGGDSAALVRVFDLVGGVWTQVGGDIDGGAFSLWAHPSVAISADGSRVALGSFPASNGPGNAQIFDLVGGVWVQVGGDIEGFGGAVSLSSDGARIAVSSRRAVYGEAEVGVFDLVAGTWSQVSGVMRAEASVFGDGFGGAIWLSGDGERVGIGAISNSGAFENAGHVRVFELGFSKATCQGKIVTSDMQFGGSGIGTANDDVISGTDGDDSIIGGGGNDTICALAGDDYVDGGDGVDLINGGPGDDLIFGGPGDDTIFGELGIDRIRGDHGDDTISGGFGIDYMYGNDGDDTLDGGGGSDRMFGGAGNDLMLGDSGADRMYGGDGDDEMRGMGGQDFMWGEEGNDVMQGNFQTDNMWGGPGDDAMFGAGGKDSLFGEAGNDALNGGLNTDYLDGGDGVDTANGGRGRDKPVIEPSIRASNGQFFDGSGCIAETIANCQPTP